MDASCYSVELLKGAYGLGIYFAASTDATHALVDTRVPFYRLPSGALAPGEASGVIASGDILLSVNDCDVTALRFPQIVEQLRQVPRGPVTLVFQRQALKPEAPPETQVEATQEVESNQNEQAPLRDAEVGEEKTRSKGWTMFQRLGSSAAAVGTAVPPSSTPTETSELQEMEGKLRELEETLSREQKCRFLAERKNVLYRNELLRVSQENAALREQLEQLKQAQQRQDAFVMDSLHLAI